jgi:hypothetical protein
MHSNAFLLFPLLCSSVQISPAPAYYPRLAPLRLAGGASAVGAVLESPTASLRRLVFLAAPTPAGPWSNASVVASAATGAGDVDLGNGFLFQAANGSLLCAYRHHDGAPPSRVFRIQLASSHDFGASWRFAATVAEGALGVWEPFLFAAGGGLLAAYSAELPAAGGRAEQDIVLQRSADGGGSWGPVSSRVHTDGSRNGMPGVAALPDGSLLLVFEGFWSGVWGAFTVNSARSFDGGATWAQRRVVHAPPVPWAANAGSPQVAWCRARGAACAVFMSSEGGGAAGGSWPAGAHAGLLCAPLDAANASAPIDWARGGAPATVASDTRFIFWPSFLAVQGGLSVAYQGDDGAAYVGGSDVCAARGA